MIGGTRYLRNTQFGMVLQRIASNNTYLIAPSQHDCRVQGNALQSNFLQMQSSPNILVEPFKDVYIVDYVFLSKS